jgi:hypothetical protein
LLLPFWLVFMVSSIAAMRGPSMLFYQTSKSSRLAQILEHSKFRFSDLRFTILLRPKAAL